MYKVLIVDDQKSSRELMRYVISDSDGYEIIGTLEDASIAESFCRENSVDLIFMDIYTGGRETGIQSAKKVKAYNPNIKIIIVTFMVQQGHIELARDAGCEGFWYKDHSTNTLLEVMDKVMAGDIIYPDALPTITIGLAKASDFTKQELTVLQMKVNGYSHQEICDKLCITRSTLNYHIANLKSKTGYENILKLAIDVSMKKFMIAEEDT